MKGVKRLTNRKRATPVKNLRKEVRPEIQSAKLPTPIFGGDPDLQKEFSTTIDADSIGGIKVTREERDIISSKTMRQRKQLPSFEITDISYVVMSHEELEKLAVCEVKK